MSVEVTDGERVYRRIPIINVMRPCNQCDLRLNGCVELDNGCLCFEDTGDEATVYVFKEVTQ